MRNRLKIGDILIGLSDNIGDVTRGSVHRVIHIYPNTNFRMTNSRSTWSQEWIFNTTQLKPCLKPATFKNYLDKLI